MSNSARGADPCAQSGTATVGTFERKKHGVSYFHDEGMTITCPAMENGGSHTLTTQENGDKKKKNISKSPAAHSSLRLFVARCSLPQIRSGFPCLI